MPTRRSLLTSLFPLAAGAAAMPRPTEAFSVTEPSTTLRKQYENACQARSRHEVLLAEIRRTLAAEDGTPPSEAEVRRAANAARCPLCGCRVSAGLPEGAIGDDRQG